ncbi:hypothetical protein Daus18300_008714 [Diaporthe australafricana]|uniref:CENP-V/GFA domain-containing protein n=1 Tax=Diaporthe australafricana TaxID=127596 RepID=A0ABR3WH90_9PEZI
MASNNQEPTTTTPHYSENPSAFPMEGGCCCGHVRYRLEQAPMVAHNCYCTPCQRETGSASSPNILIEAANVTRLAPAPPTVPAHRGAPDTFPSAGPPIADDDNGPSDLLRTAIPAESGEAQTVVRCPRCLAAVWSEYGWGPAVRAVKSGTLDRAWLVEPDAHIYVRSKRPFVAFADAKPQFQTSYDRAQVWRPEALERWARLAPKIKRYRESLEEAGK